MPFLFCPANLNTPQMQLPCLLIALVPPTLSLVYGSFLLTMWHMNESFSLGVLNLFVAAVRIMDGLHVLNRLN